MRTEEERDLFFNLSRDLFSIAGFDGYFKRLNPAWEKTLGFSCSELSSQPFLDFVHPEDRQVTSEAATKLAKGEGEICFENRYRCMNGSYTWLAWNATPSSTQRLIYAVARDITDRKQAEQEIVQLNQALARRAVQLESANQELEAFSYSVSHDLRTPLRHINGFVDLLRKASGDALPEKCRRYLDIISNSATRMSRLIDDLLLFSRTGRAELQRTVVDMELLAQEVIDELRRETDGRNIIWQIGRLPKVHGDAALLRQVWVNLLSNAVKYTRPRDPAIIEIGCNATFVGNVSSLPREARTPVRGGLAGTATDAWEAPARLASRFTRGPGSEAAGEGVNRNDWVFFVSDNGVGFDMQYTGQLFEVFHRLHRAEEFDGTGIGLANVRRIVQRHGGSAWAKGKSNEGAAFFFSLPMKSERQAPTGSSPEFMRSAENLLS